MRQNGLALQFGKYSTITSREIASEADRQNGLALEHARDEIRTDRDLVVAAYTQNPAALKFASRQVVLEVVRNHGLALQWVAEGLRPGRVW